MEYIRAAKEHAEEIYRLVQKTITTIYPNYYPQEVVDFFCQLHNKGSILNDISSGNVGILKHNGQLVGTGSCQDNHITRVYVDPVFQKQGYGSYIMQVLEEEIALHYDAAYLDASLPASNMYESRGYVTVEHKQWHVANGVVLVYEVMQKQLAISTTAICYNKKYFVPKSNTANGEVDHETLFEYHQKDNILWGYYTGGEIIRGYLVGIVAKNGELDFYYQHINKQKQVRVGRCHSIPHSSKNGKIELHEQWQWLNGDGSKGTSVLIER